MTEADHGQNGSLVARDDGRVCSKARVLEQIGPDTQKILLHGLEVHRATPLTTRKEILRNVEAWSNSDASSSNGSLPELQFQEST